MDNSGFLTVDYDESNQLSYVKLILKYGENKEKLFDTGDPLIDWYDYNIFLYNGERETLNISYVLHSSSIDHWFMNGTEYIEKFLIGKQNDDGEYEYNFMTKDEMNNLSISDINNNIKCTIQKDMKSFKDLKSYYHKNKQTE